MILITDMILRINGLSVEEMTAHGYFTTARDGSVVCPFCGNGSGEDGTGVRVSEFKGKQAGHCFRCGASFTNLDVIMYKKGLNFIEALKASAKEFFDVDAENLISDKKKSAKVQAVVRAEDSKKLAEISGVIKESQGKLDEFMAKCGGEWRGLTYETLKKFECGYLPNWKKSERVIIPTPDGEHYLARFCGSGQAATKPKQHQGRKGIFGIKQVDGAEKVFVTEGEIDAMSVNQSGFAAISFCGSDVSKFQREMLGAVDKSLKLVILYDSDTTGREKSPKVAKILRAAGFNVAEAELKIEGCKDANELLQATPTGLKARLAEIMADAIFVGKGGEVEAAEVSADEGLMTTQKIFPNCPVDLVIPVGYEISRDGIYLRKARSVKLITYDVILPVRSFYSESGQAGQFEFVVYQRKSDSWRKFIADKDEMMEKTKFTKQVNQGLFTVSPERTKMLATFFCDIFSYPANEERLGRVKIYTKTGWDKASGEFVYPTGRDGRFYVVSGASNYEEIYGTAGDSGKWLELYKKFMGQNYACRFIMGAALAAPMVELLNVRNLQLHIWGNSGTGKTAALKFAGSVFGRADKSPASMLKSFNGTKNFIENISKSSNGFPVLIDELQCATDKMRESLDNAIYEFESGETKGRLNKKGEQRETTTFRTSRLTTGEQPITQTSSGQGAINRILQINERVIVKNDFAIELHISVGENYNHYGRQWTEYLAEHKDEIRQEFKNYELELRDYLKSQKLSLPDSYITHCAVIALANYHFAKMLGIEAIKTETGEEQGIFGLTFYDIIEFAEKSDVSANSTNGRRAKDFIIEYVGANRKNFRKQAPPESTQKFFDAEGPREDGVFFRDNSVAFHPFRLRQILKEQGYNAAAVIEEWARLGYLDASDNLPQNRHHQHFFYDGMKSSYVYFLRSDLFSHLQDYELWAA